MAEQLKFKVGRVIDHSITIEPSMNHGFIVSIGCGHFVFATQRDLLEGLSMYLENPTEWQAEYYETSGRTVDAQAPRPHRYRFNRFNTIGPLIVGETTGAGGKSPEPGS